MSEGQPIVVPSWVSIRGGVLKPGTYTVSGSASGEQIALNFTLYLTQFNGYVGDLQKSTTPIDSGSKVAEPIDAASGSYYTTQKLLQLTGVRDLSFNVSYDSRLLSADSLGNGWSHNYEASVVSYGDNTILQWDANRFNNFTVINTGGSVYMGSDNSVLHDRLQHLADGTWRLTRQAGDRMWFDSLGKLIRVEDKTGKGLNVVHDLTSGLVTSVTEPVTGQSIAFAYTNSILRKLTASDGREVMLSIGGNQLLSHTVRNADGSVTNTYAYTYDSAGRILTAVSPDGNQIIRNTYNANGQVATQQDGVSPAITVGGKTMPAKTASMTTFSYDDTSAPGFRITTVTNRTGAVQVFKHDSDLQLVSRRDELGRTTTYTYDANGNRMTKTDPSGNVIAYAYDSQGNVIRITDATTNVTVMAYDNANNLLAITNALGEVRTYTYGTNNLLTSSTDALGNQTSYQYDTNGLLNQVNYPRGGVTRIVNVGGLPSSVTDPNGKVTQFEYDAAGRVTAKTDPEGNRWTYGYDLLDNRITVRDPQGRVTARTYDYLGDITRAVDPLGKATQYFYDANGNLRASSNAVAGVTVYSYDTEDRVKSVADALGRTNSLAYDPAGQLLSSLDSVGKRRGFNYDANGNLLQETDTLGRPVYTAAYSPVNQLTGIADSLGNPTAFALDAVGRRKAQTDALGRTQSLSLDREGRLTAVRTPLNTVAAQAFDADGNRTAVTNPAGAVTAFTYDPGGRMTKMRSALGRETSFGYDGRNLLTLVTKPSGLQTTFAYDSSGLLTQKVDAAGAIRYGYDAKGRLLNVSENGRTTTREYDALDRITRYVDAYTNEIRYAYDAVGNMTNIVYPGGLGVSYTYDAANRMQSLRDWTGRTTVFAYDTNGLLAQVTRPNGTKEVRAYDSNQRLAMLAELNASGTAVAQDVITWDAASQLVGESVTPAPAFVYPVQAKMTYDADDRLVSWKGKAVASDADGNSLTAPLAQGITNLTFDARGRLAATPGLGFEYDPEGMRVSVREAGVTNRFVNNPNAGLSQVLVRTLSGGVTTYYIYGPEGLLYALQGSSARYYSFDARGNTAAIMDDSGATVSQFAYSPFGQAQVVSGTNDLFMFCGKYGVQTDSGGLVYMRARYYSPYSRRFVSQDALLGQVESVASLNRFAYANGSPVMFNDPLGLCAGSSDSSLDYGSAYIDVLGFTAKSASPYLSALNRVLDGFKGFDGVMAPAAAIRGFSGALSAISKGVDIAGAYANGGIGDATAEASAIGAGELAEKAAMAPFISAVPDVCLAGAVVTGTGPVGCGGAVIADLALGWAAGQVAERVAKGAVKAVYGAAKVSAKMQPAAPLGTPGVYQSHGGTFAIGMPGW